MGDKRNQHFVPQFFLRNFGTEKFISSYLIQGKRFINNVSIRGQCQKSYLYGREPDIENALLTVPY